MTVENHNANENYNTNANRDNVDGTRRARRLTARRSNSRS